MKRFLILILLITLTISNWLVSQIDSTDKTGVFISINGELASTVGEFKDAYDKDLLFGFNFDAAFIPFKNLKAWQLGGQFEIYFAGKRTDNWSGLDVTTQSNFIKLNIINRLQPYKDMPLKPFIELAYGLNTNMTATTYEVVDEASFLEEFLFNAEDIVETETAKERYDFNHNFAIGAGIVINNIIAIQLKYNYVPEIEFVRRDGVKFNSNNEIVYEYNKSTINLITISLGFTFNTLKSAVD